MVTPMPTPEPDLYVPLAKALRCASISQTVGYREASVELRAAAVPFPAAVPDDALGHDQHVSILRADLRRIMDGEHPSQTVNMAARLLAALAGAPEGTDDA